MATRRYMANPQDASFQITEAVGAATVSKRIAGPAGTGRRSLPMACPVRRRD